MRKNDIKIIAAVLILAAILYVTITFVVHKEGSFVTVKIDGREYGTYSLSEDLEETVNGTNTFQIKDGTAKMTEADCPDQLCVHQKGINRDKETIVCLPNKVVLEVTGEEESEYDSIAK